MTRGNDHADWINRSDAIESALFYLAAKFEQEIALPNVGPIVILQRSGLAPRIGEHHESVRIVMILQQVLRCSASDHRSLPFARAALILNTSPSSTESLLSSIGFRMSRRVPSMAA